MFLLGKNFKGKGKDNWQLFKNRLSFLLLFLLFLKIYLGGGAKVV